MSIYLFYPYLGSIKFVKGFIVLRYRSDTTEVMCYVYDLSNATWKSGMEDYKVRIFLHYLEWNSLI